MKTMTIISALSLALIFTGINTSFAKQNDKSYANKTIWVKYKVMVNLELSKTLCNMYMVEIIDANKRQVAPAQVFVSGGSSVYYFDEKTQQTAGIRIARIVLVNWGEHFICNEELSASPAVRLINFKDGQVYSFDLYPTVGQPK